MEECEIPNYVRAPLKLPLAPVWLMRAKRTSHIAMDYAPAVARTSLFDWDRSVLHLGTAQGHGRNEAAHETVLRSTDPR